MTSGCLVAIREVRGPYPELVRVADVDGTLITLEDGQRVKIWGIEPISDTPKTTAGIQYVLHEVLKQTFGGVVVARQTDGQAILRFPLRSEPKHPSALFYIDKKVPHDYQDVAPLLISAGYARSTVPDPDHKYNRTQARVRRAGSGQGSAELQNEQ